MTAVNLATQALVTNAGFDLNTATRAANTIEHAGLLVPDSTAHAPQCTHGSCTNRADSYGYCGKHARHLGLADTMVPVAEAREAIHQLQADGWTLHQIWESAGLTKQGLMAIRDKQKTVRKKISDTLTGLVGTTPPVGKRSPVWPSQRRVRSLRAAGHTLETISEGSGVGYVPLRLISAGQVAYVETTTANRIDRYWREHMADPVTPPTRAAKNWVVPMWWDDIDNPDEQPGVSHCRDCHTPNPGPITGLCTICQKRHRRRQAA